MTMASEEQDEKDRSSMALLGSRGNQASAEGPNGAAALELSKASDNQLPPRKQGDDGQKD